MPPPPPSQTVSVPPPTPVAQAFFSVPQPPLPSHASLGAPPPPPPPQPSVSAPPPTKDLAGQLQRGKMTLRKTSKPVKTGSTIQGALSDAIPARRTAINPDEDDDEWQD